MSILKVKCYLFALFVFWKMCLPYMKQFELSDPLINESILIQDLPFLNLQFIKNDYQSLNETSIQCMDFRIISTRVFNLSINIYFKTNRNTHTNINKIVDITIVSDVIIPPWNIRITENSLRPPPQPRQTKLSLGPPPPFEKYMGKLVYILQSSTCVTIVIYFDL